MKRVLPAALALTVALSAVPVFADTTDRPILISPNPMAKSDVVGTEYEEAVKKLLADGVVSGYGDGSFQPENPITRAEVCAMLIKAGEKAADTAATGSADAADESAAAGASFIHQQYHRHPSHSGTCRQIGTQLFSLTHHLHDGLVLAGNQ